MDRIIFSTPSERQKRKQPEYKAMTEVRAGSTEEEEVISFGGGGWGRMWIGKGVPEKVAIELGLEGFIREYWVRK